MAFLYLIFYACLRLRFLDMETNPGPWHPVPAVSRILSDLTMASSRNDIVLCSETVVSDMFTNVNCCRAGRGCVWLFPVCGWFEWRSSGVVGFYNHKSSWCCSCWLCNCVCLWSVGCCTNPCTWWKTCELWWVFNELKSFKYIYENKCWEIKVNKYYRLKIE